MKLEITLKPDKGFRSCCPCTHEVILMKLNDLATQLNGLAMQLNKAAAEILGKIADLETALYATDVPEDAAAAIEALKAQAQALDDIVPDVAPVEPPVE